MYTLISYLFVQTFADLEQYSKMSKSSSLLEFDISSCGQLDVAMLALLGFSPAI